MRRVLFAVLVVWNCIPVVAAARAPRDQPKASGAGLRAVDSATEVSLLEVRSFRFRSGFGREITELLEQGEATVADWPLRATDSSEVTFERIEVYSPDAKIFRVDGDVLTEVPRSAWTFASGVGKEGGSAWLAIDETGRVRAASSSSSQGEVEIVEARDGSGLFVVRAVNDHPNATTWECASDTPPRESSWLAGESQMLQLAPGVVPASAPPATLLRATLAVDTDEEFMNNRLDDTTTATDYIASLLSQVNVFYRRDVNVLVSQGTTFLRTTSPDPYNRNDPGRVTLAELQEYTFYWQGGCGGTCTSARPGAGASALATLLSGKGGLSGRAWLSGLCQPTLSYSYSAIGGGSIASVWDARVVAHEVGHNFGSPHTHCYAAPKPDICSDDDGDEISCNTVGEFCPVSGTYQGITTRGTLMSQCEQIGCLDNFVFHPQTMLRYFNPAIADAASAPNQCLFPALAATSITPNTGGTAGGTPVTIRGIALGGVTAARLGGVPLTALSAGDTTVTGISGPHAAGAVGLEIDAAGGDGTTLAEAYFYADAQPAASFYTSTPCRIVDTRGAGAPIQGGALGPGERRTWNLAGVCGVSTTARSVSANVTITASASAGRLSFYPGNAFPFGTTTLEYGFGQTRANNALLELATDGAGTVGIINTSAGTVHVILDVNGHFR